MLAIKECLIREGVLNLKSSSNISTDPSALNNPSAQYDVNSPYTLYRNRYSFGSNLNMLNYSPKKSATDVSVNDLSSANSATAKTSCQQQEQQPHSSQQETSSSSKPQIRKLPKRYQGHHPHFHHHTAPAYYTDLHLKIHTPEAKDSVNENYQSVYRTPSKLIKDEHQFPKTAKVTLPAPLPLSPRLKLNQETLATSEENQGSFFRGAASHKEQQQLNYNDPYMPSNKKFPEPSKGKSSSPSDLIVSQQNSKLPLAAPVQSADGSVVFACTNFKPCVQNEPQLANQNVTSRSRNSQRFASRKRAVRVRSESRPISALYDIICKEKGLDIVTTTTNDEDSSPSPSQEDERTNRNISSRSHSRSLSRQAKHLLSGNNNINMSGSLGNNLTAGDHSQHRATLQQKKRNDKYSPNTIFINDLSDDEDDDTQCLDGSCSRKNVRLRNSYKKPNLCEELQQSKSSSLPPGLLNLGQLPQSVRMAEENHHNIHESLANVTNFKNTKESLESVASSSGSKTLLGSKANHISQLAAQQSASSNPSLSSNTTTTTNTALSVEPIHMHLSSSCSLNEQPKTGAGTINNPSQQQDQLKQAQTKTERNLRKHRRLRDIKPRRHTDGAIKLVPSELNDLDADDPLPNYEDNDHHHQHIHDNDYSDDDYDNDEQHHPSQFYDLNGAGHDFLILSSSAAAAANAKRYITRSQRLQQQQQQQQTNDSRSSPSVKSNQALNAVLQQNLNSITNCETTTATATQVESNGHTIKTNGEGKAKEEEMTNNSGKKSKTTTTVTANTTTTNTKELKMKIPLTSEATSTIAATASAAVTTAAEPNSLCLGTSDKKKDEEKLQQLRYTSPTSPKPQHYPQNIRRVSPSANCLENTKQTISGSEVEYNYRISSANSSPTHRGNKKLIPSVSVSMKQNLSETQCIASRSNSLRANANSPKSPKHKSQNNSAECTLKVIASPKAKTKSIAYSPKTVQNMENSEENIDADFLEIHDLPLSPLDNIKEGLVSRPRCSTINTDSEISRPSLGIGAQTNDKSLEFSPVHKSRASNRSPKRHEERDKSSKRKSNLNRSLNEEATPDGDDNALRRRRRRELGMSRPLVPNDDASLKALLSPHKTRVPSPTKSVIRNDLSYHMEMARKGLDLATTSERRRAQTASPKSQKDNTSPKSSIPISKFSKRCDTNTVGEMRKERFSEVNRKLNERTRTGLEEIMKIVENVSDSSPNPSNAITDLTQTINRLRASQEREKGTESLNLPGSLGEEPRRPSPVKHATFMQEECIYYEPDPLDHIETYQIESEHLKGGLMRPVRILKAKSIERETAAYEPTKLSPILRRKSTDCPPSLLGHSSNVTATPNHIVSILKKKDHLSAGESSSASSNASPVTFSSSVMDTPSKQKRTGILKKRSSLDESRYYSRSHSPDERSILIKSVRRNSLEEVANGSSSSSSAHGIVHHGILKQSSYDSSKSDGCPSASREAQQPHSILKKKDSTSTPSDGGEHAPKHVSISQAVILAAAELSAATDPGNKYPNDDLNYTPNNEEYDIKPILKLDSSMSEEPFKPPKPILKKKSSGDSDEHEIKPILKTSRKSSREEFEFGTYSDGEGQQETQVRPILKSDSPFKRRSLGEPDNKNQETYQRESLSPFLLKRRTRSLERHDQAPVIDLAAALNAIATSQALPSELVSSLTNTTAGSNISVAERIKSVEKFLANQTGIKSSPSENLSNTFTTASTVNTSWESPLQNDPLCSSTSSGVKILKPSVIRRDLHKDRFKTQPVTSNEKNFFKTNVSSSSDALPSGSAFKPAQSLERLGFAQISTHGNQSPNAPPSAFTLTRSYTQPLSSSLNTPPQSSAALVTSVPVPLPRKSIASSIPLCGQDNADLTLSFTGDCSSLAENSNSERIFEMSGLEQDFNMADNPELKTPLNKDSLESSAPTVSVVRTNSVKARANMFQKMQEKTSNGAGLNREERTSPKRAPRRLSPSSSVTAEEYKTPTNLPQNPDDEIEPSSLPLSERLRFFSSLSEGSKRNSYSFTRSPPFNSIERCSSISSYHFYMATTPRSSTSLSSASVTPTPMESPLPLFMDSPTALRRDSSTATLANEVSANMAESVQQDLTDSRFSIKADIVKTSPFLQAFKQAPFLPVPVHVTEPETTPTSSLTPTMKRIKLKTVGKLLLPSTFLRNDSNLNSSTECSTSKDSSLAFMETNGENENLGPPKKIGKIKSPFIENCNQKAIKQTLTNTRSLKFDYNNKSQNSLMALTSLENNTEHHSMDITANTNGLSNNGITLNQRKPSATSLQINGHYYQNEDFSTDSGKENVDTTHKVETTPVVEMRRKFTRKANTSQSFNNSTGGGITRQLTPRSVSLNGPHHSSPQVDDKYAKYFGLASTSTKSTKINHLTPLPRQQTSTPMENYENFGLQLASKANPPPAIAVNRNVRRWHSSTRGIKRLSSVLHELKKFEEIVITERELKLASKEFDNLLLNDSVLKNSPKDVEKIFSTIV